MRKDVPIRDSSELTSPGIRAKWLVTFILTVGAGIALGVVLRPALRARSNGAAITTTANRAASSQVTAANCSTPITSVPAGDIQHDPKAADYNPAAFLELGVAGLEVFGRESRNESWAGPMETTVGSLVQQDLALLAPDAKNVKMECRSRSCMVTWLSLDREGDRRVRNALGLGAIAPVKQIVEAEGGTSGLLLMYPPPEQLKQRYGANYADFDATDASKYGATYQARRKALYTEVREGKRPLPETLTGATIPQ